MKPNKQYKQILYSSVLSCVLLSTTISLTGCGPSASADSNVASVDVAASSSEGRTNEAVVLTPVAGGTDIMGSDNSCIDYSNASEGYIVATYLGECPKVKFQITGSNQVTYTYNLIPGLETVIPLSSGSGNYNFTLYENISNDQYAINFSGDANLTITNEFGPFLYPNQYVNFTQDNVAVAKAKEIVSDASCDLEAVSKVYEYVISNVTYDKEEAENVESNYLPDVDEVLATGKGICFDYASLMAAMLRSQGIPTKLEIGYAKDAYHAWISVYTSDQGWIGGVINFDGTSWTLMDPTLASNSKDIRKIKDFIGDGSSYTVKYVY